MFKTGGLSINTTAANAGTPQPAASGGLFGSTANQGQQGQQQQTGGGGLFGSTANQPQQQQQPQQGGGLFGSTPNQGQQQQGGGSLFGSTANQGQQQQQGGGGMFGSTQNQARPGGLFAQSTPAPAQQSATGGGLTMGQSTNQQTVPGVRVDLANLKGTTKFNDLTPELQKEIEACDNIIQMFVDQARQLQSFKEGHKGELERLTQDLDWLQRKFDGVKTTLEEDVQITAQLKELVKSDAEIAKAAFSGAEQLKLPAQYHTTWLTANKPSRKPKEDKDDEASLEDCITIFMREADRLDSAHRFQVQKIKELEAHMPGVQNGLYERMCALRDGAPQFPGFGFAAELLDTIKALNDEIIRSAGEIVQLRENLTKIQLSGMHPRK